MDMSWYPHQDPEVQIEEIRCGDVVGFHLLPHDLRRPGVVVTVGGSEGSPDFFTALDLARRGHECFAMFFFGQDSQRPQLDRVPLELWQRIITHVRSTAQDASTITACGGSKGAEFLLVAASEFDNVDHLVLTAPTAHVWPGLAQGPEHSSWTLSGHELEHLGFRRPSPRIGVALLRLILDQARHRPARLRPLYEAAHSAANTVQRDRARIDARRYTGDLVLVAGGDDQMWPSVPAAREIVALRPQRTRVQELPGMGHFPGGPTEGGGYRLGGTVEANEVAGQLCRARLQALLDTWHPARPDHGPAAGTASSGRAADDRSQQENP